MINFMYTKNIVYIIKIKYSHYTSLCITMILYPVVPRHLILQMILLLIFPKSEPGQLQKN